jgi:hypothetical protein
MDWFDLVPIVPSSGRRSSRSSSEDAAGAISIWLLPFIAVCVLLGTGLHQNDRVALTLFPLLFAALSALLCRALGVRFWWSVLFVVGCAAMCWIGAAVTGLFDALFLPW